MSQLKRNKTCSSSQPFNENNGKNFSRQPRARKVHRNTSADVLNQTFIYQNSNDYRRKRISNQFVPKPPSKRGNLDPSDNILNQAFIDSRPVRGNSKPASYVLNQAFIHPSSNLQRKRTRNPFTGTPIVGRENSNPSGNVVYKSFIEPRRYREHTKPSSDVLNQAFLYPRSNECRSTRVDNQNVKKTLPQRETTNAARRFPSQAGRDVRPVRRYNNLPTNIPNQPSTNPNYKLQKDRGSERFYQRPPVVRARSGHAVPIPEQCIKRRKPTPHQNLVQCTPQVSPRSTFNDKISSGQQNNSARTVHTPRSSHNIETPLCHLIMSSAPNLFYSPEIICPDKKKTRRMRPARENYSGSVPKLCRKSVSKARSTKSAFLPRQDAKTDCFDDFKESLAEFQVELPKEFWTDPSKKLLMRDFLDNLERDKYSENSSAGPSKNLHSNSTQAAPTTKSTKNDKFQKVYKKTDEERAKRKEFLIKHLRSTLKQKIPQLKLVVKMLELILSWKHLRPQSSHERSYSDETAALSRDEFVDHIGEKPGWCCCNKKQSDQLRGQKPIKQEGTSFKNFALKPEPH